MARSAGVASRSSTMPRDPAVGLADDPTVAGRIVEADGEQREVARAPRGAARRSAAQGLGADQRDVTVEDQDVAVEAVERRQRRSATAWPVPRCSAWSDRRRGRRSPALRRPPRPRRPGARRRPRCVPAPSARDGRQRVVEQRAARQLVQHLGAGRTACGSPAPPRARSAPSGRSSGTARRAITFPERLQPTARLPAQWYRRIGACGAHDVWRWASRWWRLVLMRRALRGVRARTTGAGAAILADDDDRLAWATDEPYFVVVRKACRTLDVYRYGERIRQLSRRSSASAAGDASSTRATSGRRPASTRSSTSAGTRAGSTSCCSTTRTSQDVHRYWRGDGVGRRPGAAATATPASAARSASTAPTSRG